MCIGVTGGRGDGGGSVVGGCGTVDVNERDN